MQPTWVSILPPILVVIVALWLQRLNYAILIGIIAAAYFAGHGSIPAALNLLIQKIKLQCTNTDLFYLYCFLICIPSLVQLCIQTGSAAAFTRLITKKIKKPMLIELACCTSSCLLSIDDYLSILTVGQVMRTTTDHVRIARAKLAYLIHTCSGAIVILCPISSWVAAICVYLQQSGIDNTKQSSLIFADPFSVYLGSIPYMLYSILTITTVLSIIFKRFSFGPMAQYEQQMIASNTGMPTSTEKYHDAQGSAMELIIPLIILVGSTLFGILYEGGFYLFGGTYTLLEAFKNNTQIFFVLATSSLITLVSAFLYTLYKKHITIQQAPGILYNGFQLMKTVLIMLILLSILNSFLKNELATGTYLATVISATTTINYLPGIMFILALIMSLATGSSWGTFGLLLPIAVPMLSTISGIPLQANIHEIPLLYPVLGAIFSGAVCGDHISLFSETTIMSAACTQISPLVHFKTQLLYALPPIIGSLVGYIMMGYMYTHLSNAPYQLPLFCAIGACYMSLSLLQKLARWVA